MDQCPRCKSEALEPHTTQFFQEFEGEFFNIENVPTQICSQCGEIILTDPIAEEIQETIWSGAMPKSTQQAPLNEVI